MRFIQFIVTLEGTPFRDNVFLQVHNNASEQEINEMADSIAENYLDMTGDFMEGFDYDAYDDPEEARRRYEEAYDELYWSWRIRWIESTSEEYYINLNKKRKENSSES